MSIFAVLLLCIQACLVQNVFGQCGSIAGLIPPAPIAAIAPSGCGIGLGPAAYAPTSISYAPPVAYSPAAGVIGTAAGYGAIGEGNVAVSGELPVAGNTAVAGQVPIIGIVSFGGAVPAAGAVSIAGQCACGCSSIY